MRDVAVIPDSTLIGPVTITCADIDALAGAQAAAEVLADCVSPQARAAMLRDAEGCHALANKLIAAIARQVAAAQVAAQGAPS